MLSPSAERLLASHKNPPFLIKAVVIIHSRQLLTSLNCKKLKKVEPNVKRTVYVTHACVFLHQHSFPDPQHTHKVTPRSHLLYQCSASTFASDDSRLSLTAADQHVTATVFLIILTQKVSVFVGVR